MAPRPPIIDPTQPLPRLTLDEPWIVDKRLATPGLLPGRLTLDPWVEDTLRDMRASNVVMGTAQTFPPVYLDEIERKFRPVKLPDGKGCMLACYGVLAILYTEKVSKELHVEVFKRAKDGAKAYAKAHPDELKAKMAARQAANRMLTDEDAKKLQMDQWISDRNTSDHLYALMGERGLAEQKVKVDNAKAEQAIRSMTGDVPGLFFFGLAVNDNHTVTLAVERAADGSQRMYWLDQNQEGKTRELRPGELAPALRSTPGKKTSTNIYPFLPPTASGP